MADPVKIFAPSWGQVGDLADAGNIGLPTGKRLIDRLAAPQIVNVISGKLELTIDKETRVLEGGMSAIIPSNVPHTAKGITDCKVIDVFYLVREDYKV